ncbi:MAG: cytochrome-c oxidase, cbb3-type subunit III [Pseudorhodoplanes sp.]|nr:cytochrome-c oxidase, cbb3-type subunit III [Pseudorhodoplanes sp.]GIK80251.1 MAG: Cbb3-type cytochrome c oxidase subunit FixP [Alphaproteobacteria bacterium]
MARQQGNDIDALTGTETTGHVWDGIRELNTPLPRWWLWLFYVTIVWSIGYWVVYPAWPLVSSYTTGYFNWHSRQAIVEDLAALKAKRATMTDRIAQTPLEGILADSALLDFARAYGRAAFADNCAPCHGAGGGGVKGYPNLNDDDWLWGGKLEDIVQTIRHGIRAADNDTRQGSMPAFGRDKMMERGDILVVADYVRSLARLQVPANTDLAKGQKLFAENCASCHGDNGKGNRELGAPDLTDQIWLYGSSKDTIIEGLMNGRSAVMPAWNQRLDDTTIKALTVYVHTLGGGEK